jgi:hypothetical protein
VLLVGVLQIPTLLHTDAAVTLPVMQVAAVQMVVLSGKVQVLPLLPSHCPVQIPVPLQTARGASGLPLMVLHLPTEPASLHDSH